LAAFYNLAYPEKLKKLHLCNMVLGQFLKSCKSGGFYRQ
jgi:hypothetical protein